MNVAVMLTGMRALEYRRENRKRFEADFDCEVEVEIYKGLRLMGWFKGKVQFSHATGRAEYIADPEITLYDKDEKPVDIDWDDLEEPAQDWVEHQVKKAFNGD